MMQKIINVTFLTFYCSLIFWLSSQPSLPTPQLFIHQDKIHHFGAYFIMAILAWRLFNQYGLKTISLFTISLIFCSLYGLSDEWHQSFVVGRDADVFDWLADTVGALTALTVLYLARGKLKL